MPPEEKQNWFTLIIIPNGKIINLFCHTQHRIYLVKCLVAFASGSENSSNLE
jgi:hypothetical protein